MPKNEEGEFELILGNRQLLSVFFIVVILLGVFFTMGYIVGRNSSPVTAADASKHNDGKPLVVDGTGRPAPASGQPGDATVTTAPADSSATTGTGTTPVAEAPKPAEPAPEPKKAQEPPRTPAKEPERAPEPKPAASASASPVPDEPAAGQWYLQLAAVAKSEAQIEVEVLGKRGFHAIYTQKPDQPNIYRVLVGPYKPGDNGAVNQARSDLQKVGLKGYDAILRKY